jgi:hypothetical protein
MLNRSGWVFVPCPLVFSFVSATMSPMDNEKPSETIPTDLKLTHDGYFRETFQTHRIAKAALKKVLPKATIPQLDLDGLTVVERQRSDAVFKELSADVIYKVPVKETKEYVNFFVVMEHKSFQDYQTIFQLWGYVYRICYQEFVSAKKRGEDMATYRLPPIVAIIVFHGRSEFKGKTELAEWFLPLPGLEPYLPRLQAVLFDLSTVDDDDPILNDPEVPELKVVLMVLKTVFRKDVVLKVTDVLRALKPHSDDPTTRRIILATWIYLTNNAKHLQRDFELFLGTVQEVVGEKVMPTMVEIWQEEGAVKTGRNMVLKAIRKKFSQVPQEIEAAVLAMSDPIALESLLEHALDSGTLDEFSTALK